MDIFEEKTELQRTDEWFAARFGKFTASRFGDLMTKGRKKDETFGGTAISYMMEVAAEQLTGQRVQIFGAALDHGNEYESVAREEYEKRMECEVEELGFCEISDYSGGSPDGKVKDSNKLIEIKCPYNTANHLKNVINQDIDKKYHVADARLYAWQQVPHHVTSSALIQGLKMKHSEWSSLMFLLMLQCSRNWLKGWQWQRIIWTKS
jgi:hypothetical protein